MIIGLTGKTAAGKGTVADYLKEKGFLYHSLSDVLREELKSRNVEEDLPNLIKVGNELRTKGGPGVLGKDMLKMIEKNNEDNSIVDSIRNPVEIEELKKTADKFILIAVDAPIKKRYERAKSRNRAGDNISFEEFEELDIKELKSADPNAQQILDCFKQSDYTIVNEGTLDELKQKIEDILIDINQ